MDSISVTVDGPVIYQHVASCDSTMDVARVVVKHASPSKVYVISTDHQKKGKGRFGRTWSSGEGNLMMSVCLPYHGQALPGMLMEVAALLRRCIQPYVRVFLKWPNDVYGSQGKVAGLLLEKAAQWCIIGVGVNTHQAPHAQATSMMREAGFNCCKCDDLKRAFVEKLLEWKANPDFRAALHSEWQYDVCYLKERVFLRCPSAGLQEGVFVGVTASGQARILQEVGEMTYSLGTMRPCAPCS